MNVPELTNKQLTNKQQVNTITSKQNSECFLVKIGRFILNIFRAIGQFFNKKNNNSTKKFSLDVDKKKIVKDNKKISSAVNCLKSSSLPRVPQETKSKVFFGVKKKDNEEIKDNEKISLKLQKLLQKLRKIKPEVDKNFNNLPPVRRETKPVKLVKNITIVEKELTKSKFLNNLSINPVLKDRRIFSDKRNGKLSKIDLKKIEFKKKVSIEEYEKVLSKYKQHNEKTLFRILCSLIHSLEEYAKVIYSKGQKEFLEDLILEYTAKLKTPVEKSKKIMKETILKKGKKKTITRKRPDPVIKNGKTILNLNVRASFLVIIKLALKLFRLISEIRCRKKNEDYGILGFIRIFYKMDHARRAMVRGLQSTEKKWKIVAEAFILRVCTGIKDEIQLYGLEKFKKNVKEKEYRFNFKEEFLYGFSYDLGIDQEKLEPHFEKMATKIKYNKKNKHYTSTFSIKDTREFLKAVFLECRLD